MPLSGIRVVDLTRILAGPFCTMILADMGAEIIKVEPPGRGDPLRAQGVIKDGLSWYFAGVQPQQALAVAEPAPDEGKAVLARLIAGSDVLVENYRPGVLGEMGFDEARLKALKPDLVYANISGFGNSGPYRDRPSFDFIAQAMSGFMSVTGRPTGRRCGPGRRSPIWSPDSTARSASAPRWSGAAAPAPATRSAPASTTASSASSRFSPPIIWRPARSRAHRQRPRDRRALRHVPPRRTARSRWRRARSNPTSGWSMRSARRNGATTRGF